MQRREPVIEMLDPITVECLRRMTPQQRLAQAAAMWKMASVVTRAAVAGQYPDWDESQIQRETVRRLSHGATESVPR